MRIIKLHAGSKEHKYEVYLDAEKIVSVNATTSNGKASGARVRLVDSDQFIVHESLEKVLSLWQGSEWKE